MPFWMNVLGAAGFGMFYGYVAMYILKRYVPPLADQTPNVKELVSSLTSLVTGGIMAGLVRSIDGVNFVGAYGLGLALGAGLNVIITIWLSFKPKLN
jgi:hypothetical protein